MRRLTLVAAAVMAIATNSAVGQTGGVAAVKSEPGKVTVAEAVQVTIFSKKSAGRFPDDDEIVEAIRART